MPLVEYGVYGVLVVGTLSLIVGLTHKNYIERLLFAACCVSTYTNYYFLKQISLPPELALQGLAFEHFTASAILASAFAVAFVVTFSRRLNSRLCLSLFFLAGAALIVTNYFVDGRGLLYFSVTYDYTLDSFLYGPMSVYSRELGEYSFLAQAYFMVGLAWTSSAIVLRLRSMRRQLRKYISSIFLLTSYFIIMLALVGHDIAVDYGIFKPPYLSQLANFWLVLAAGVGMVQSQFIVIEKLKKQASDLRGEVELKEAANKRIFEVATRDADTGILNAFGFSQAYLEFAQIARDKDLRLACHVLKVKNYSYYARQSPKFAHGIIRIIESRIRAESDSPCLLARTGFDELIVLCLHDKPSNGEEAQFLSGVVDSPMQLEGNIVTPSIEIGGILKCPSSWSAADIAHYGREALLSVANNANVKIRYIDQIEIAQLNERNQLELDLVRALDNREIAIAIQPKYDGDGRLLGGEVLARWQHPVLGNIAPDRFIAIAEERGLIAKLGGTVLEHCFDFIASHASLFERLNLCLAVNVSPWQLKSDGFYDHFLALLNEFNLPAKRLKIEITESTFVDDPVGIASRLKAIRALGIDISLDDFGTGYSSLSQLFAMPISELKIDRTFIGETAKGEFVHNHSLLSSVYEIARSQGLDTVIEGVETREQLEVLRSLGFNCFQGYYFSRPLSPADFIERAQPHISPINVNRDLRPRTALAT